ncbi:MAG: holo-ACP synthase [Anaerolineae bacterium]
MELRSGIDLIETSRIRETLERSGDRFLKRIFTLAEIEQCGGRIPSLAGRYAVKEAVSKAFRTGIGDMRWVEIEIVQDDRSAPHLVLHGDAAKIAESQGLTGWSISISHTEEHAIGMAVAIVSTASRESVSQQ